MNVRFLPTILFSLLTVGVLLFAWLERDEFWYNAENGIGYAFGIIGSTMMVLLLLENIGSQCAMLLKFIIGFVCIWFLVF